MGLLKQLIFKKQRYLVYIILIIIVAISGFYYIRLHLDHDLTNEELSISIIEGEKIYYKECANCHTGDLEVPSLQVMKNEYSSRQLNKILAKHPESTSSNNLGETEKRNIILFLRKKVTN